MARGNSGTRATVKQQLKCMSCPPRLLVRIARDRAAGPATQTRQGHRPLDTRTRRRQLFGAGDESCSRAQTCRALRNASKAVLLIPDGLAGLHSQVGTGASVRARGRPDTRPGPHRWQRKRHRLGEFFFDALIEVRDQRDRQTISLRGISKAASMPGSPSEAGKVRCRPWRFRGRDRHLPGSSLATTWCLRLIAAARGGQPGGRGPRQSHCRLELVGSPLQDVALHTRSMRVDCPCDPTCSGLSACQASTASRCWTPGVPMPRSPDFPACAFCGRRSRPG